jgi:ADP-ribosylglycohydrolase
MRGAIVGDVIGSVFEARKEWMLERNANFQPLFSPNVRFTDDTVLTIAVAEYLLDGGDLAQIIKNYYERYPSAGYGGQFKIWAKSETLEPYGSFGNGSAMRVSPVAYVCNTLDEVLMRAKDTADVTHNHPEGVRGAKAIAAAIYLARTGADKQQIAETIEKKFQYDLSFTIDGIRPTYAFDATCQGTVPHAIVAFLESTDFESAVRLAISLGGDADTLAAMAGSIAEPFYGGVPADIWEQAASVLDEPLLEVVARFEERFKANGVA